MATSKDALIAELQAVRAAKLRALKTGQQVQVSGAMGVTQVSYAELCRAERDLRARILRSSGAASSLRPYYTGSSTSPSDIPENLH